MLSTSVALSSGERFTGVLKRPTLLNGSGSSFVNFTPLFLLQSSTPSISLARSSGAWPGFGGSIWSINSNWSVGSSLSLGGFPFRTHVVTLSRSERRSSGDRKGIGSVGTFCNGGTELRLSGGMLLFRTQSRALSISRALSSGCCKGLWGRIWSIISNSPVVSSTSSLPCLIQVRISSTSFALSSGVRRLTGTEGSLSNGATSPFSSEGRAFLIQSNAPSISLALSSGF
mmetsp:Transcript_31588/g.76557  ORF Transcript_31588/g.76557 Transcript_31588/m.76557 type:complete len:229 (-) Transcript_31588:946-1632(-)